MKPIFESLLSLVQPRVVSMVRPNVVFGTFVVRTPRVAEKPAILALVRRAFGSADHDGQEEVDIVRDTWASGAAVEFLELIGVADDAVIGHVLGARGDLGGQAVVGVAPLCVAATHRGQGVGTALMEELLRRADQRHWPLAVVLGDPRYYGRFGFEPSGPLDIVYPPADEHDPHFQVRRLSAFAASFRGPFRYCWE